MSPHLPAHLLSSWFEDDAPVPTFMIQDADWMHSSLLLDDPVYVRFPDGEVRATLMSDYLSKWILSDYAVIIAEPGKEDT